MRARVSGVVGALAALRNIAPPVSAVPPSAPLNPALVYDANSQVLALSWSPPTSDGGAAVNHYEVALTKDGASAYTGNVSGATELDLTAFYLPGGISQGGTANDGDPIPTGTYSFTVLANNAGPGVTGGGRGPAASSNSTTVTGTPVLGNVSNVVATPSGSDVTVTWTPPSDTSLVDKYYVRIYPTGDPDHATGVGYANVGTNTFTFTGLPNGTYTATCRTVSNTNPVSYGTIVPAPDVTVPAVAPSAVFADYFNRSNRNLDGDNGWTYSPDADPGSAAIVGNKATTSGYFPSLLRTGPSDSGFVEALFVSGDANAAIKWNALSGVSNFNWKSSGIVTKKTNRSQSGAGASNVPFVAGDVVRVEYVGSQVKLVRNGLVKTEFTADRHVGGALVGFGHEGGSGDAVWTDVRVGSLPVPEVAPSDGGWQNATVLPNGRGMTPVNATANQADTQGLTGLSGRPYRAVWSKFTATTAHPVGLACAMPGGTLDGWISVWDGDPTQASGGSHTGSVRASATGDPYDPDTAPLNGSTTATNDASNIGSNLVAYGDDNAPNALRDMGVVDAAGADKLYDGQGFVSFTPTVGKTYYVAAGRYASGAADRWAIRYFGINEPV